MVRWIRKPPDATMETPSAPLPAASAAKSMEYWEAKSQEASDFPDDASEVWVAHRQGSAIASVAGEPGLTLVELEKIALANNPTLVQAVMRVQAARGKCAQAGLYPNPVVGYVGDEMGAGGTLGQQGAFVGQEIVTAGKLRLRGAVAGHEVVQAEHAQQAQCARVLNDVRSAWYEVLVAQRIVALSQELVHIGEQAVAAAGDLAAAREVSRVDLLQARIEADSTELRLSDARNQYQASWRRLAALLGVPDMKPAGLAGSLEGVGPELTWEQSLQRLLAESPELAEARAGVERARCAVAQQCAERVPNIDVRTGVRYHHEVEDTVATVEVGLPLPIFNRNQGNIYRARSQQGAAEQEVRRVELALRQRLAAAFQRYTTAREDVRRYAAQILPNAKTSLELVQAGYRKGEYDYLTLLLAQRTFFQVNLAYLEGLKQTHSGTVAIEGLLLSGGLERSSE
ncbi:MAG: TolC family protein [Pirellulales bacterium]|nr:TolC family protein [Pirellulales bacterium]